MYEIDSSTGVLIDQLYHANNEAAASVYADFRGELLA